MPHPRRENAAIMTALQYATQNSWRNILQHRPRRAGTGELPENAFWR